MKNLDIKGPQVSNFNENSETIGIALNKYVDLPSIFKIKEYFNKPSECNFPEVAPNNSKKEIKSSYSSKGVHLKILLQNLSIKAKMYVRHYEIYGPKKLYKQELSQRITPVFQKNNLLFVKSYRPVSVLPTVSKKFERTMQSTT